MKTYSEKLRSPKWQKKRLEIFKRDKFKCTKCGDKERELQVHHLKYTGEPWDAPNENLITLCKYCHFLLEFGKKNDIVFNEIHHCPLGKIAKNEHGVFMFKYIREQDTLEYIISFPNNSETLEMAYKLSIK